MVSNVSQEPAECAVALRGKSRAALAFDEVDGGISQLADSIARQIATVAGGACILELLSDDCRELDAGYAHTSEAELGHHLQEYMLARPKRLEEHPTISRVVESGEPRVIQGLELLELRARLCSAAVALVDDTRLSSALVLPLRAGPRIFGVLCLTRHGQDAPSLQDHDLGMFSLLAESAALTIANASRYVAERSARQRAEGKFRSLLECAPDAMVLVANDGRIELVNARTEKLFGYSRDELQGQWVEILVPERHRQTHSQHRADNFTHRNAGATGSDLELWGLRKDGAEFPIEISLSRLEIEHGVLVSSIRDITGRRKADEQRAQLAAIVDSSDDAIIGKTLDGIVTSWNDGAQRIFGYTAEEIVQQPISVLVPAGRENEEAEIVEKLALGRVEHFETVRLRNDGRQIHVSVTGSPMRDSAGGLIGASEVVRDITERRRVEQALARAKDATDAASLELEAFSYSVAHDLRAPLRGMNGFAQLLIDRYRDKLDAEGQDWLHEILSNARKMGALIDALLSLARLTRIEPHLESMDLASVVRSVAAELSAASTGRVVELSVPEQLPAELDPELARALIENLLGNAWKFTSKVPVARIEVGVMRTNGSRAFFVRDNGAGFDMAFVDKLFRPFQRLHAADEYPGTGIGLATVQRIVRRHGGRIWAEGSVGAGATFFFSLPEPAHGASE